MLGGLASGCGGSTSAEPPLEPALITPSTIDIAPELLQPLHMLGECQDVTDPGLEVDVPGLVLPDEAFLVEHREQGELTNVRGYVPMTPVQFQVWIRERTELEMIHVENEVQESETLYSDGTRRVFLKGAAVCKLGTVFIAVVADEVDADAVPTPSGTPVD